jgi:hypothetical protein
MHGVTPPAKPQLSQYQSGSSRPWFPKHLPLPERNILHSPCQATAFPRKCTTSHVGDSIDFRSQMDVRGKAPDQSENSGNEISAPLGKLGSPPGYQDRNSAITILAVQGPANHWQRPTVRTERLYNLRFWAVRRDVVTAVPECGSSGASGPTSALAG